MNFILSITIAYFLFILLDFSWIFMNFDYYMTLCRKIQKEPFVVKIPPIILAYIILFIAFYIYITHILFIIKDNNTYNKYGIAIIYGLLFGLVIYGTYSLTSCIYYKNYTYYDAFKDTLWGMILMSVTGVIFMKLYKK